MIPLDEYRFRTMRLSGHDSLARVPVYGGNRFAGTWLGRLPVPLPADMMQGIDSQMLDFERGVSSFLRGRWSPTGWWYYYLYAWAVKMPLGTWLLLATSLGATCCVRNISAAWRDEVVVLAPFLSMFILVSSQTGCSVHSRYAIPALPFLFIWISKLGRAFLLRRRGVALLTAVAFAWSVASSLVVYPHSISYFNELAGGPRHGARHLLDSNIDWGQDLYCLQDWLREHPHLRLDGLAYHGSTDPQLSGIPETPLPPRGPGYQGGSHASETDAIGPQPGWYALSVNHLYDVSRQFSYFLRYQPTAMAGYSIWIYHITPADAARVRRELGLADVAPQRNPEITDEGAGR
jgi:hypothetical protein